MDFMKAINGLLLCEVIENLKFVAAANAEKKCSMQRACVKGFTARRRKACWRVIKKASMTNSREKMRLDMQIGVRQKLERS